MRQGFEPIKKKQHFFDDDYAPVRNGKKKKDSYRKNRQSKASNKYGGSENCSNDSYNSNDSDYYDE